MPSTRNLFLVGGFVRLRADEVLSPRGKVPKGRRGRPKGACLMAAPGPPVAKEQCTASLAGARPAGFTSVPGRATVAFKVGFHFVKAKSLRDPRIRLWRKRGLAQLIPPPAPRRRSILGVMARNCCGRDTLQRYVPRLRCHAKCVPHTGPVGQVARESTLTGTRGAGGATLQRNPLGSTLHVLPSSPIKKLGIFLTERPQTVFEMVAGEPQPL